jgi:hypothetical protein
VAWRIRTTMDENKIKGEKEEVFQEELVSTISIVYQLFNMLF